MRAAAGATARGCGRARAGGLVAGERTEEVVARLAVDAADLGADGGVEARVVGELAVVVDRVVGGRRRQLERRSHDAILLLETDGIAIV